MQLIVTNARRSGIMESAACRSPLSSNKADRDVAPFLKSLRKMLNCESALILRWTPNGRAFEIHDMEQMMESVLPKYFKHRKYTSFQRQLNYFNFRKWTKSKAVVCTFSNEFFLRDQPELAWRISRKKSLHHAHHGDTSSPTVHNFVPKSRMGHLLSMPHLQHQHMGHALPGGQPRPNQVLTHPYWMKSDSVAISVPRPSSLSDMTSRLPFPSPTDQDMMLKEHDQSRRTHHYGRHYDTPAAMYTTTISTANQQPQPHHHESMDWIDCLLPPVDRIEDEIYTYMYPQQQHAAKSAYEFVAASM